MIFATLANNSFGASPSIPLKPIVVQPPPSPSLLSRLPVNLAPPVSPPSVPTRFLPGTFTQVTQQQLHPITITHPIMFPPPGGGPIPANPTTSAPPATDDGSGSADDGSGSGSMTTDDGSGSMPTDDGSGSASTDAGAGATTASASYPSTAPVIPYPTSYPSAAPYPMAVNPYATAPAPAAPIPWYKNKTILIAAGIGVAAVGGYVYYSRRKKAGR